MNKIAFDIGGTGVQYAVFENGNRSDGEFSVLNKDKEFTLTTIAELIKTHKATHVGISSPCAVDSKTGKLFGSSGIEGYGDFNLYEELRAKVPFDIKVIAMNDGNSALFANVYEGINTAVQIAIGTGIGGALFINGSIHEGIHGMAGEFGYTMADYKGEPETISNICSTRVLIENVNRVCGTDYKNAVEMNESGNPDINDEIEIWIFNLSKLIVEKHFSLAPDVIFLSGGITNNKEFMKRIKLKSQSIIDEIGLKGFDVNIQIPKIKNQSLEGAIKLLSEI